MRTVFFGTLFFGLLACASSKPPYARRDWGYPADLDGNCRNTRAEILIQRSVTPVVLRKSGCSVARGKWEDFYYPETITDARKLQIDHVVSLKNAHDSGGFRWTRKQRQAFANDQENLVITSSKTNQQKGARGIDSWVPIHPDYACRYLKKWLSVKQKYQLEVSQEERLAVARSACP